MKNSAKKILSFLLTFMMLTSLLPVGMVVFAEGENDTTLSQLSYTFNGTETEITLVADDVNSAIEENRYVVILPYVAKTLTADKLPKVFATTTNAGANAIVTDTTLFPGTAKVAVTAADATTKRNYYIRFKYQPGTIGPITNSFTTGVPVKAFYDFEPLTLTELREVYRDVGSNWDQYNMVGTDFVINGISSTPSTSYLPETDEYITVANTWRQQYITKQQTSSTSTASTTYFNGASRIASPYTHRNQSVAGDWMTFNIDRGATVWVIANTGSTLLPAYESDTSWTGISTSTTPYTVREAISTAYNRPYHKHFDAGTITLPKTAGASNATRAPMVFLMWDAPGTGDTSLATMTATVNGVPQTIDIIPDQTTYRVMVPQGSSVSLDATLTDSTAEMLISQTATSPGTATISVASGRNVATYTINFDSLSSDSSLKTLTYNHPMMGNQSIALTSGVTEYNVVLPYGISSEIPQIAAEANHGYSTIESITQAGTMPGSASVVVKAEDNSSSTYSVNFSVEANPPVVDHIPGNITNYKTRYLNSTSVQAVPMPYASVYPVPHSRVVPSTKYDATTGYATNEERIAAALSLENPYWTDDTSAWAFGDRPVTYVYAGTESNPIRLNTQNIMIEGTSSVLVGENVSRLLVLNNEKDVTVPVDDFYSFDIDKGATVYIAGSNIGFDTRYAEKGWARESSLRALRGNGTKLQRESDTLWYMVPNGAASFSIVYSKRFSAGANVTIPNRGATTSSGFMVFVVWDECNSNTALTDLKMDGTTITGFATTKTTYDVELPYGTTQAPAITATPAFDGAIVEVLDPQTLPGTATINISAADGVTTGSYTINYTLEKATPVVSWPTVSAIISGQTFADAISGGIGDGVFTIQDADVVPEVSATPYTKTITFTPNDAENYKVLTMDVEIMVNAALAGDVNGDGEITIADVIMAAEIAVGYTNYTSAQISRANVSSIEDPTVDIVDLILILERVAGATGPFPVEQ